MIERDKVIEILNKAKTIIEIWIPMFEQYNTPAGIDEAIALLKEQDTRWRPFIKRELTPDEAALHPEWCYILDGDTPDDEQEILLYRPWRNKQGYIVELDTFMDNGCECYLEGARDIENGMYWMPLPEPPEVT